MWLLYHKSIRETGTNEFCLKFSGNLLGSYRFEFECEQYSSEVDECLMLFVEVLYQNVFF